MTAGPDPSQELLRRSLLEEIDALRAERELLFDAMRSCPPELLSGVSSSNSMWGSILAIAGHVVRTQEAEMAVLEGSSTHIEHTKLEWMPPSIDELERANQKADDKLMALTRDEPDLLRIVRYSFPTPQDLYRKRFYWMIQENVAHAIAHRAHIYLIARGQGIEFPQNAFLYYHRDPPPGSLVLDDREIFPDQVAPSSHAGAVPLVSDLVAEIQVAAAGLERATAAVPTSVVGEMAQSCLSAASRFLGATERQVDELPAVRAGGVLLTAVRRAEELLAGGVECLGRDLSGAAAVADRRRELEALFVELRRYESPNIRREYERKSAQLFARSPEEYRRTLQTTLSTIAALAPRLAERARQAGG